MKLYASNVKIDKKDRTIAGILLPFDEYGYTNQGKVKAKAGTLEIPDGPLNLNLEHEIKAAVGISKMIRETADGLYAIFEWLETTAGKDAFIEATKKVRAGLSIEIDDVVIRNGQILAGRITGAAQVVQPAFMSARLVASEIVDAPDEGTLDENETNSDALPKNKEQETPEGSSEDNHQEENDMNVKKLNDGGALTPKDKSEKLDKNWLFATMAGANIDGQLRATLSDIVPANTPGIEQPQYVGELWDGKAYQRRFIPLFNHADLTSFEVLGWKWKTKPEVDRWEGNKKAVPSNAVESEQFKIAAQRIAGAHDIDRKYRDFNNKEFFRAYFAAMTESYAKKSDLFVLQDIIEAATVIERGEVPSTDIASGLVSIVDGAISVLNETETMPTGAVVALDLWREILLTPKDKTLEYLEAAIDLETGTLSRFPIVPSSQLNAGEVLVAAKDAATVHELGNGAPIRVEALDIARGGVDEGVFGYYAVNVHDAGGIALVTSAGGAQA